MGALTTSWGYESKKIMPSERIHRGVGQGKIPKKLRYNTQPCTPDLTSGQSGSNNGDRIIFQLLEYKSFLLHEDSHLFRKFDVRLAIGCCLRLQRIKRVSHLLCTHVEFQTDWEISKLDVTLLRGTRSLAEWTDTVSIE